MAKSPTHKLGQLIGELFEESMKTFLEPIASSSDLYLDFLHPRAERNNNKKVKWKDSKGNYHDLDYVLEKGGSDSLKGIPVAFIEIAWRRYTKHSKNKAQEIGDVLSELGLTYKHVSPFNAAILCGEFTRNAIEQLESKGINVAYISYDSLVSTLNKFGVDISWEENTDDSDAEILVDNLENIIKKSKFKIINQIITDNNDILEALKDKLMLSVGRAIKSIDIIPLYGENRFFIDVVSAKTFLEGFDEESDDRFQFNRYIIMVKYTNGSKIEAEYFSKSEVISFLQNL